MLPKTDHVGTEMGESASFAGITFLFLLRMLGGYEMGDADDSHAEPGLARAERALFRKRHASLPD